MRKGPAAPATHSSRAYSGQKRAFEPSKERTFGSTGSSSGGDPALRYAYLLLSYRGRTEKEMIGRLRMKGFDDPSIDKVVERLRSGGLLDDRKLASSLKRYAGESKHLGILGTRRFLAERGVPRNILEEATAGMDDTETARRLVEKKIASWGGRAPDGERGQLTPAMIRKLYGILSRRGFLPETIKRVMRQIKSKEDSE
jgi:regulatory protein